VVKSKTLDDILKELIPDENELQEKIILHKEARRVIEEQLKARTILSGSYKRHTGIKPINDIDIVTWLPKSFLNCSSLNDVNNFNPQSALDRIKQEILKSKEIFDHYQIRVKNHSLRVTYKSDSFSLDIIPSFSHEEPAGDKDFERQFLIPEKNTNKWILTNPVKSVNRVKSINNDCNQKIIPIIRLIKSYRNCIGKDDTLISFHIESLALYLGKNNKEIYNNSSNLFEILQRVVDGFINLLEDGTDIVKDLELDNDPSEYLKNDPARKEKCIRKLKSLDGHLNDISQMNEDREIIVKLRNIFLCEDDEKSYTKVSQKLEEQRFA
jgi:hypothetical protein